MGGITKELRGGIKEIDEYVCGNYNKMKCVITPIDKHQEVADSHYHHQKKKQNKKCLKNSSKSNYRMGLMSSRYLGDMLKLCLINEKKKLELLTMQYKIFKGQVQINEQHILSLIHI